MQYKNALRQSINENLNLFKSTTLTAPGMPTTMSCLLHCTNRFERIPFLHWSKAVDLAAWGSPTSDSRRHEERIARLPSQLDSLQCGGVYHHDEGTEQETKSEVSLIYFILTLYSLKFKFICCLCFISVLYFCT